MRRTTLGATTSSSSGAGVRLSGSNGGIATFEGCLFRNNSAYSSAAIYMLHNPKVILHSNTFVDNDASNGACDIGSTGIVDAPLGAELFNNTFLGSDACESGVMLSLSNRLPFRCTALGEWSTSARQRTQSARQRTQNLDML